MTDRETRRLAVQESLDAERSLLERNKDGQFATPTRLARQITAYALGLLKPAVNPVRVLEPSCGTGSFVSAVLDLADHRTVKITGVELDRRFVEAARDLWGPDADVIEADYLSWCSRSDARFDLLVANPPYVRHHHLTQDQKERYSASAQAVVASRISKLAGLYVYFVLTSQSRLAPGAVSTWLIPGEFMGVNYGSCLREFLTATVTLDRIHVFDAEDVQFSDALVTSCVVTTINQQPTEDHRARLTFGSDYDVPSAEAVVDVSDLAAEVKWQRLFPHVNHVAVKSNLALGDLFQIRRGIATGSNEYFIRPRSEFESLGIPEEHLTPVLPSPRGMKLEVIPAGMDGWPVIENALALLDCKTKDPSQVAGPLKAYLDSAPSNVRDSYLVGQRKPWFKQEQRPAAPIVCTYMGRGRNGEKPFRFIRNRSRATVTNTYLAIYPKQSFLQMVTDPVEALDLVCEVLADVSASELTHAGREYGGGLQKIEPRELANLAADTIVHRLESNGLLKSDPAPLPGEPSAMHSILDVRGSVTVERPISK